jgi:sortase A
MRRTRTRPAEALPRLAAPARKWRASPLLILTISAAFAAVNVLTYSTAASWVSALNQSQVVTRYDESINHTQPSAVDQLRAAHAYNAALSSGALLAANERVPQGSGELARSSLDYNKMLVTPTGVMARLQIPKIDVDLPIYHGTSEETLEVGVGHLEGTSLPVGGPSTHSVLTGHRGLPSATLFTNLDEVEVGDLFTITTFGDVLTYRVRDKKVVAPEDTQTLRQIEGQDLVTLVTCTPLGVNSHRILVTGERVTPTPPEALAEAAAPALDPGFPWWAVAYVGALILIGLYAWWAGTPLAPRRPKAPEHPKLAARTPDDSSQGLLDLVSSDAGGP